MTDHRMGWLWVSEGERQLQSKVTGREGGREMEKEGGKEGEKERGRKEGREGGRGREGDGE